LRRERQEKTQLTAGAIKALRSIQDRSTEAKDAYLRCNSTHPNNRHHNKRLSKQTVDVLKQHNLGMRAR
jgi:hypothetical protein